MFCVLRTLSCSRLELAKMAGVRQPVEFVIIRGLRGWRNSVEIRLTVFGQTAGPQPLPC
jgi:hypothetical protein